ncbi:metal ABC transporter ATP-binding protein [Algivirga pacifica]|uniref:Manganese ABC transporter ATP-binding protein MntB n=1 Tax=Algivirga pacifica TaxID=1162670 RepID=A0ABP9D1M4_9BACT
MKENTTAAIEVHNLSVTYDGKPAAWNIDYELPQGKLIGVMGPNGSGKSTSIKAIMDLVPKASGYARIFGKELDEVRQRVAYVPQRGSVDWDFPASVLDTVLMGRLTKKNIFKRISKKDRDIALECIRKVRLDKYAHRQISQLSGGQQQRVFIARALAQQADLYLLDEPFAGVDASTEDAIISILKEMKEEGKTVLVVHHDLQTAPNYFDWLVLMNTRLVAAGPMEETFTSEYLNEAFGGRLNILSQMGDLIKRKKYPIREKKNK